MDAPLIPIHNGEDACVGDLDNVGMYNATRYGPDILIASVERLVIAAISPVGLGMASSFDYEGAGARIEG